MTVETLLLIGSLLILFSIGVARAFNNFGVPTTKIGKNLSERKLGIN
jgi:hypothetical protein